MSWRTCWKGEISIGTAPAFTDSPRSTDTVRGTVVVLESSAEILAKKIGGRILRNNTFVPRELYDLVMARHCESAALDRALRCFTPDLLQLPKAGDEGLACAACGSVVSWEWLDRNPAVANSLVAGVRSPTNSATCPATGWTRTPSRSSHPRIRSRPNTLRAPSG